MLYSYSPRPRLIVRLLFGRRQLSGRYKPWWWKSTSEMESTRVPFGASLFHGLWCVGLWSAYVRGAHLWEPPIQQHPNWRSSHQSCECRGFCIHDWNLKHFSSRTYHLTPYFLPFYEHNIYTLGSVRLSWNLDCQISQVFVRVISHTLNTKIYWSVINCIWYYCIWDSCKKE